MIGHVFLVVVSILFPTLDQLICTIIDFNFTPDDPAYSLLVGDSVLPVQESCLMSSRVVHFTVDPDLPRTGTPNVEEEGTNGSESDRDNIITNARLAAPADGLLTTAELAALFVTRARSTYDDGLSKHRESTSDVLTYGDRINLRPSRQGANEPEWTSYTHYWKTTIGKFDSCGTRTH
jgi:RNA exonuclease NGL2